jgi:hypothetical protein
MQSAASTGSSDLIDVSAMSAAELATVVRSQAQTISTLEKCVAALTHQQYRRPVIKRKASARILALPAASGVLQSSRADVSFVAGQFDSFRSSGIKAMDETPIKAG